MNIVINVFIFLALLTSTGYAQALNQAHTEVVLLTEGNAVKGGDTLWAAVRMRMDPEWHVYWKNPGDSGEPPRLKWHLPQGWSAGEIQWPTPKRIDLPPLASYGYEGEVFYLVQLQTAADTPQGQVELKADVNWLACKVQCIPGKGAITHTVEVTNNPAEDAVLSGIFDAARNQLPKTQSPWSANASFDPINLILKWQGPVPQEAQFFPESSELILHAAPQTMSRNSNGFELKVPKSNLITTVPTSIKGIIKADGQGYGVEIPVGSVPQSFSFWLACVFAFIGGIILNVMPCVLPVLSIKITSLAAHQHSRRQSIAQGASFALGVIVSFWALAGILIFIQKAGAQIGWGFQFQSPVFVGIMIAIFLGFALNLFGVFEIGANFAGLGLKKRQGSGLQASFFNGLFATVVATPCTAPFMGSAIAYALTQSAVTVFVVFTFLGLGMAAPMFLLSMFPRALKFLPKPGPWMTGLKRIMGILMLVSALWLAWVLSIQLNSYKPAHKGSDAVLNWQKFSPELLEKYKSEGKSYFLDFTAAWCLTCQVNDRVVLSHGKIVSKVRERGIMMVKADWTSYDPAITKALSDRGRNSIPLYAYYSANTKTEEVIGEVVTVNGLLETLNK